MKLNNIFNQDRLILLQKLKSHLLKDNNRKRCFGLIIFIFLIPLSVAELTAILEQNYSVNLVDQPATASTPEPKQSPNSVSPPIKGTPIPAMSPTPECDTQGIIWSRELKDFSGSQWDVYQQFVVLGTPSMCWSEFKRLVVEYNPQLQVDDGIFYADKIYFIPEVNQE